MLGIVSHPAPSTRQQSFSIYDLVSRWTCCPPPIKLSCAVQQPQASAGPESRPIQLPSWDVQSRASSAGYSAAYSVATATTAATGVTHASAMTAPAGMYGGPRGGSGRMRMMLPSPSRHSSRPPSRAASIAGDFRRGSVSLKSQQHCC